jgi:hypothetical protein
MLRNGNRRARCGFENPKIANAAVYQAIYNDRGHCTATGKGNQLSFGETQRSLQRLCADSQRWLLLPTNSPNEAKGKEKCFPPIACEIVSQAVTALQPSAPLVSRRDTAKIFSLDTDPTEALYKKVDGILVLPANATGGGIINVVTPRWQNSRREFGGRRR